MMYGMPSQLKFLRGPAAALLCLTAFGIQKAFAYPDEVEQGQPGETHAESSHETADAAHAGAEAHGSGGLPQFDPSDFASQIFWLAVVFGVLYFIFARKSLPAISNVLETREQKIQGDRDLAEQMKNEAVATLEGYEKSLGNARAESARISSDTTQAIKTRAEESLSTFQQKAEAKMTDMETGLNNSKHQAMDEMNTIAAEIASAAAEKIVGISTDINQAKTVVKSLNKISKAA